jgi:hypothetical protein
LQIERIVTKRIAAILAPATIPNAMELLFELVRALSEFVFNELLLSFGQFFPIILLVFGH